nr:hypothetical protein [Tanacetum cinerariifolium]
EELYFSNNSKTANVSKSFLIPNEDLSNDTTPSVARKFLNEVKSTIVTLQHVVKQRMTIETEAAKFVGDFKSLANEANVSLAKHKALELEIERLLKAVVSQDIMIIMQNESVVETSNLQTELERTKERFENCIIKKENEYAKLWNDWYKKCDECKYDKISYDKAYKDMQQKIKRFQAQLGDLKDNTKTRRPQLRSNTKHNRVPSAYKSSQSKNKEAEVEKYHRNLLLSYTKINHLSGVFVPQTALSREELYFSNISKTANVSKSISIPNEDLSDDTTPSVARKFLNEVKSTIVTLQRVVKQRMTIETHNWASSAHQEFHKIVREENFPIGNQFDARVQNFKIQFLKEAAKFVGDFKSLAKEADASLAKHKILELEIERLLKAVVSQDIISVVQNASVVDTSDLQTELERTKERFKNCIIKKETKYAKFWNDWYKKCNECKYDKISYDKAYKDMQQKIERLQAQLGDLKVVSQDIISVVQNASVVDTSDLQTELERTKERFENCIIKKETEYAKLWNDWYKKCNECKYDKISYDKAYKDMQQNFERLQAQLEDLKGKSKDTSCVSNTLNPLSQKLENENVELEFQVLNYARENAHLKATYKNLFDSISMSRVQTETKITSLQNELQSNIYKNAKLRTQLFKKVFNQKYNTQDSSKNTKFAKQPNVEILLKIGEINALSKPVTSNSVSTPQVSKGVNNAKVIAPGMFRISPDNIFREAKKVPNTVSTRSRTKPITVSQPNVITKKIV